MLQSAETGFTSRVTESQQFIESLELIELTNVRTLHNYTSKKGQRIMANGYFTGTARYCG
jgi:hypothetical protein